MAIPFKSRLIHISCDGTSRQQPPDTESWDVPLPEDWVRRDPLEPKIKPQTYLQLIFTPKDNDALVSAHQKSHKHKAKSFMVAASRRTIIVQTTAPQPISFNTSMVQAFFKAPLPRFGEAKSELMESPPKGFGLADVRGRVLVSLDAENHILHCPSNGFVYFKCPFLEVGQPVAGVAFLVPLDLRDRRKNINLREARWRWKFMPDAVMVGRNDEMSGKQCIYIVENALNLIRSWPWSFEEDSLAYQAFRLDLIQ